MNSEDIDEFYADLRWEGWIEHVEGVGAEHGLFAAPPLVFESNGRRRRGAVPIDELWRVQMDLARQLGAA